MSTERSLQFGQMKTGTGGIVGVRRARRAAGVTVVLAIANLACANTELRRRRARQS